MRSGLAVAAGFAIGFVLNRLLGGSNLGSRVSTVAGSSTYSARLTDWTDALRVTAHHPAFGTGPGQATTSISPLWTSTFARGSTPLADTHNFFVEILVTTGLVGLFCLLLWMVPVLRHARGPLLVCGIAMLSIELVEPMYIGVTPIAFLVLGAAISRQQPSSVEDTLDADTTRGMPLPAVVGGPSPTSDGPPRSDRVTMALRIATTGIAVIAACLLLVGDADLHQGLTSGTNQEANLKSAIRLLPPWPDTASDLATTLGSPEYLDRTDDPAAAKRSVVMWAQRAVDRDPGNFEMLTLLAVAQQNAGDLASARSTFNAALARFPWYAPALSGLASLELQEGNAGGALGLYRKATEVSGGRADQYQVSCLSHVIPRHLTTGELLTLCPATPPFLALLGAEPPGWIATPSATAGQINSGHSRFP
jgi:hypothetical protein